MPSRSSVAANEFLIVDNSDNDRRLLRRLRGWHEIAKAVCCPANRFEIGAPLTLKDEQQRADPFLSGRP